MDLLRAVENKENLAPWSPNGSTVGGVFGGKRRLRFADEARGETRYHPYKSSSSPCSSDEAAQDCIPPRASRVVKHDSSDPAFLLPPRRYKGILKATTHPINVVGSGCAEEGKQRNAPRRHSLPAIDSPLEAIAKALVMQTTQSGQMEIEALLNAVETLEASLDNEGNSSVEPKGENDNCSPRNPAPVQKPPTPPNSSSPIPKQQAALIGLRDVEAAYSRVCVQLRKWGGQDQPASAGFIHALRSSSHVLIKCLTRDLENVLNPQAPSLMDSSSSSGGILSSSGALTPASAGKRKKQGRSEAEIRRRRVELEVGQAALKLVGILTQNASMREAFPARMLLAFVEMATRIPFLPTLRSTGDREILAFASWVMGNQGLPPQQLGDLVARMAVSLSAILSHPAKANDKTRRIITETLGAIEHLASNHPQIFLSQSKAYLFQVLRFMGSQWAPLRDAAVCALGRIALNSSKDFSRDDIGRRFFEYYRLVLPSDPAEPGARRTHLTTLGTMMTQATERNETAWTLTIAAILPVLSCERFRQLEDGGPKIWMGHMQSMLHHTNHDLRLLTRFAWNHLAYSWILMSESHVQTRPDKIWAMSPKPFELLTQILTYDAAESKALKTATRARTLITLLYAFSGFLDESSDRLKAAVLHQHLSLLFETMVQTHIRALILLPSEPAVREAGWRTLAAICGAPDELKRTYDPTRLLCRPLLTGAALRFANNTDAVVQQAIAEAIQPAEISAWKDSWILENANLFLPVVVTALRSAMAVEDITGLPVRQWNIDHKHRTQHQQAPLELLWRCYLKAIVSAWRQDPMTLLATAVAAAQDALAAVQSLSDLPFAAQLSDIAIATFADFPLPSKAPAARSPTPTSLDSLSRGDFLLLSQTRGPARLSLWLSLVPIWLASLQNALAQPERSFTEAHLVAVAGFAILSIDLCNESPACVPTVLEVIDTVSEVHSIGELALQEKLLSISTSLPSDRLARGARVLLEHRRTPMLIPLARLALARIAANENAEEASLSKLLSFFTSYTRDMVEAADVISCADQLRPAFSRLHSICLNERLMLYKSLLDRIVSLSDISLHMGALEPFLVAPFLDDDASLQSLDFALALKEFWAAASRAQGISPDHLTSDVLKAVLLGVDAAGLSQMSKLSTIDSQKSIELELESQSMDMDITASMQGAVMRAPPSPELGSDRPADDTMDSTAAKQDRSIELGTMPVIVSESIETPKKRPLLEIDSDDDDVITEEEIRFSQAKRARYDSPRPNFAVVVPFASPRLQSSSPSSRRRLRRSLSAPSSREPSPIGREMTPGVEGFLNKMRAIWEERADVEMRTRLDAMDEDSFFRLFNDL